MPDVYRVPGESVAALPEPPIPLPGNPPAVAPKARKPPFTTVTPLGVVSCADRLDFFAAIMHDTPGPKLSPWPTTRWTLIDLMADAQVEPPSPTEIGGFLEEYLALLQSYLVRRRGLSVHDAEDILQEFILQRFLSQELARHVDQMRGRFRSFLLTSLDNFLRNHYRKQGAKKRSPAGGVGSLDGQESPAPGGQAADDLYEIEWARMIVRQAIGLVQDHCEKTDRLNVWNAFEARVVRPILDHSAPESRAELAERLGMDSARQVDNAVATAKRIYKRALHGVVIKYARSHEEVDAELAELRAILARQAR